MADSTALEISAQGGTPIELYEFAVGVSEFFYYTSAEGSYTFGATTYEPETISRDATEKSRETPQENVTVKVPSQNQLARTFIGVQSANRVDVQIMRVHEDASPQTAILIFDGYISSISVKGYEASLLCIPFNAMFSRVTPRFTYQGICNHSLYDTSCQVDKFAFDFDGLVSGVSDSGRTITVNGADAIGSNSPADAFIGGYIQNEAGDDFRMIVNQTGDSMSIFLPFKDSPLGTTVTLFQGCDHSHLTCKAKFDNLVNFGGFPYVPSSNLFSLSQFMKTGRTS